MQEKYIREENKIELYEDGALCGYIRYEDLGDSYSVATTFVDEAFRGKGIAGKLMQLMDELCTKENKTLKGTCSYAVKWIEKNK